LFVFLRLFNFSWGDALIYWSCAGGCAGIGFGALIFWHLVRYEPEILRSSRSIRGLKEIRLRDALGVSNCTLPKARNPPSGGFLIHCNDRPTTHAICVVFLVRAPTRAICTVPARLQSFFVNRISIKNIEHMKLL
jgi:hypothetical protein